MRHKESVVQRLRRRRLEIDAGVVKRPRRHTMMPIALGSGSAKTTAEKKKIKSAQEALALKEWQFRSIASKRYR